jgi:hypothetical protein
LWGFAVDLHADDQLIMSNLNQLAALRLKQNGFCSKQNGQNLDLFSMNHTFVYLYLAGSFRQALLLTTQFTRVMKFNGAGNYFSDYTACVCCVCLLLPVNKSFAAPPPLKTTIRGQRRTNTLFSHSKLHSKQQN